jgi:integrase
MAYENSVIDSNPMSRVKRLREPQGRERYLTPDEEEKLLEALATYGEHLPDLAILALETRMRLGELLNARWEHINQMAQTIHIPQTKTDKPRRIPLSAKALAILKSLRQDAPEEELIFDSSRTGRKRRQMMVCFESAVKKTEIADFHFHDLRHTFATRLRASGTHEMDIMTLLGHSTLEMTLGYSHAVAQKLRTAID